MIIHYPYDPIQIHIAENSCAYTVAVAETLLAVLVSLGLAVGIE